MLRFYPALALLTHAALAVCGRLQQLGCDRQSVGAILRITPKNRSRPGSSTRGKSRRRQLQAKARIHPNRWQFPPIRRNQFNPTTLAAARRPTATTSTRSILTTTRHASALPARSVNRSKPCKTLVVWLLDKGSASNDVRGWLAQRMQKIVADANRIATDGGGSAHSLAMAIVAFGSVGRFSRS